MTEVPGGILRFTFTVRLSSSTNSSYLEVTTISGVILTRQQSWSLYQPASCRSNPCYLNASVRFRTPPSRITYCRHLLGGLWAPARCVFVPARMCARACVCGCGVHVLFP